MKGEAFKLFLTFFQTGSRLPDWPQTSQLSPLPLYSLLHIRIFPPLSVLGEDSQKGDTYETQRIERLTPHYENEGFTYSFFSFFFFYFLGPHPWPHPRLEVKSELQLLAYITVTANAGSEPHLRSTPQLTATPDP